MPPTLLAEATTGQYVLRLRNNQGVINSEEGALKNEVKYKKRLQDMETLLRSQDISASVLCRIAVACPPDSQ
jgi:hypothetical protein